MKIKNEKGTKWISCDNLGELVEEFKKFRNSKNADERKNYSFGGGIGGDFWNMIGLRTVKLPNGNSAVSEIIDSAKVYQKDGVDLSLNIAPLNWTKEEWKPYSQKIEKILKEIWETGEVKDYQGLDLNWPEETSSKMIFFCDQCHKWTEDRKAFYFSDIEKNLDFCSESCHSKFKAKEGENQKLKEQLKKATNQKNFWMTTSIVVFIIFVLALLFCWVKIRKIKKGNKKI